MRRIEHRLFPAEAENGFRFGFLAGEQGRYAPYPGKCDEEPLAMGIAFLLFFDEEAEAAPFVQRPHAGQDAPGRIGIPRLQFQHGGDKTDLQNDMARLLGGFDGRRLSEFMEFFGEQVSPLARLPA
jgi:hypothetical protein